MQSEHIIALRYNNLTLTKSSHSSGGKNANGSPFNGFYRAEDGSEYFVKQPLDKREFWIELFAGKLITKLKPYLPEGSRTALVCADLVQTPCGDALIQPKVKFTELFKLLGTGTADRSVAQELWRYNAYTKLNDYELLGLGEMLMCSLLVGDYSVHSGNVMALGTVPNEEVPSAKGSGSEDFCVVDSEHATPAERSFAIVDKPKLTIGRIDWGAAFRAYNQEKDIRRPKETEHWMSHKWITKRYLDAYSYVDNAFRQVARAARDLSSTIDFSNLQGIIRGALTEIPVDLLDPSTRQEIANYICIPEFAEPQDQENFINKLAATMLDRLSKIIQIEPFTSEEIEAEYQEQRLVIMRQDQEIEQQKKMIDELQLQAAALEQDRRKLTAEAQELKGNIEQASQQLPQIQRSLAQLFRQVDQFGATYDEQMSKRMLAERDPLQAALNHQRAEERANKAIIAKQQAELAKQQAELKLQSCSIVEYDEKIKQQQNTIRQQEEMIKRLQDAKKLQTNSPEQVAPAEIPASTPAPLTANQSPADDKAKKLAAIHQILQSAPKFVLASSAVGAVVATGVVAACELLAKVTLIYGLGLAGSLTLSALSGGLVLGLCALAYVFYKLYQHSVADEPARPAPATASSATITPLRQVTASSAARDNNRSSVSSARPTTPPPFSVCSNSS